MCTKLTPGLIASVRAMLTFLFQAEDGIRDIGVTRVQTCALPILAGEVLRLLLWRAPVEVVGAEVAPEGAVAQHVPEGGEHGGGDGADGLLGATALPQPLELRPEIAVLLAAGGPGALDEGGLQPGRALAQPRGAALARALVVARAQAGPGDQVAGGGEAAHVEADLGEDHLRGEVADPGVGAEQPDRVAERVEVALHLGVDLV